MTIKEVADTANVTEKTVRGWITKASVELPELSGKTTEARRKGIAARFTLPETIAIIRAGGNETLALLLEENANQSKAVPRDARIDRLESMMEKMVLAVASIPQSIALALSNRPKQLEYVQDYFTIKGYASKVGVPVTYSEAISIGRVAVKLSHEKEVEIRKADDERFGQVNSYHVSVLKEVFQA